ARNNFSRALPQAACPHASLSRKREREARKARQKPATFSPRAAVLREVRGGWLYQAVWARGAGPVSKLKNQNRRRNWWWPMRSWPTRPPNRFHMKSPGRFTPESYTG